MGANRRAQGLPERRERGNRMVPVTTPKKGEKPEEKQWVDCQPWLFTSSLRGALATKQSSLVSRRESWIASLRSQ